MKLKQIFCCGAAMCLATTGANAAVINLVDRGGVKGSAAEKGFKMAALYWESVLTNDVTVNLGVSFRGLGRGVIGSTNSQAKDYRVSDWERQVGLTRSTSTLDKAAILPTLNAQGGATFITNGTRIDNDGLDIDDTGILTVVDGNSKSSQLLFANTAVLKAIGGMNDTSIYSALDMFRYRRDMKPPPIRKGRRRFSVWCRAGAGQRLHRRRSMERRTVPGRPIDRREVNIP